jgi:hypothetical protein
MDTKIPLTRGETALVDDWDRDWLIGFKWHTMKSKGGCYATRTASIDGKQREVFMHRAIWELHNGSIPPGMESDHINGDGLDNRSENLRIVTHAQNSCNKHRHGAERTSKFKGVTFVSTERWRAQIMVGGKQNHIGYFETEEEAASAYNEKARELHGEYANLNPRRI